MSPSLPICLPSKCALLRVPSFFQMQTDYGEDTMFVRFRDRIGTAGDLSHLSSPDTSATHVCSTTNPESHFTSRLPLQPVAPLPSLFSPSRSARAMLKIHVHLHDFNSEYNLSLGHHSFVVSWGTYHHYTWLRCACLVPIRFGVTTFGDVRKTAVTPTNVWGIWAL